MMTLHRNASDILKGSLSYLASGAVNSIAPFLVSLLVSRYLGKDALGLFSICFALVLAGVFVSDFGLNPFILREFAGSRLPAAINLRTLLLVRGAVSILAACGIFIAAGYFVAPHDLPVLGLAASVLLVLRSMAGALENVIKARLYRTAYAVITVTGSASHVALVYGVLHAGYGLDRVLLTMAGVEAARTLWLLWMTRADLRPPVQRSSVTVHAVARLFRQGLPFALIGVFTLINERSALFFLSSIRGNGDAGMYSAADRFLIIGTLIDSSLFSSGLPILSLFRGDALFHRVTRQTLSIALLAGIVSTIVLFAGAPLLIGFSFQFPESIDLLRILSFSLPALLCASVIRIALFSLHRERQVAAAFSLTCVLNICLNTLVVPRFASTGAAAVSVFTEYSILAAYGFLYLRSVSRDLNPLRQEIGKVVI